jgi:hypothetical protein
MKPHSGMSKRLTLPLPAFVLHPLTALVIAAIHVYLASGHLQNYSVALSNGLTSGKGSALASRGIAARSDRQRTDTRLRNAEQ